MFKELRKRNNLTQKEFAKSLGIAQGIISEVENGLKKPSYGTLCKIMKTYGEDELIKIMHQEDFKK